MEVAVIIRVRNERASLKKVLKKLKEQTYQDFELVIVDNSSTDGSDKIAFDYFSKNRIKVINIPKNEFKYPYASNLGAKNSIGKYLVYLSAHSYPLTNTWLADGLVHFKNEKVAGVFAYAVLPSDTTFAERVFGNLYLKIFIPDKVKIYKKWKMGVLGTTNAIIRRCLWEKYNFNEKLIGGEDVEWAKHWMEKGYVVVHDPAFRVYHSHYLSFLGMIKQYLKFRQMNKAFE